MTQSLSCMVLGAGLMGRLLAHALAQLEHRVEIHEAQGPLMQGSAAWVAAAMLAPLAESAVTELPVVRMGLHSIERWPAILAQLSEPVFFQRNGTLIVWHRQDAPEARRFEQLIHRTTSQLPERFSFNSLEPQDLAEQEPELQGRFERALFLAGEGQLDNRQLLSALLHSLRRQGVKLNWHSARSPSDFQPGTTGQPDWVFDCRGLGARPQWPQLRGVRGEVIRLHAPAVNLRRPLRLIHPRYPLYIAPKENHLFVVGATEIESDDVSPASVRSTLELLSAAYTVHSGFAEARILEINTQARPTLPDNLPSVRFLGERCVQINGLYRHGFLIAPALTDALLEWVEQGSDALAAALSLRFEHD